MLLLGKLDGYVVYHYDPQPLNMMPEKQAVDTIVTKIMNYLQSCEVKQGEGDRLKKEDRLAAAPGLRGPGR